MTPTFSRLAIVVTALLSVSCASALAPLGEIADDAERARTESLRRSVEMISAPLTNFGRYRALEQRVAELGLAERASSEWIDWFSLQRNLMIEINGRPSNQIVYVVAHYDKIDANPFSTVSVLLNGLLDPLISPLTLSAGAVDNATGVAVTLELAAAIAKESAAQTSPYRFRFLFVGSEEYGLRGSRAHVARLSPEQKEGIELAMVLDSVGLTTTPNCVIDGVSDPGFAERARERAGKLGMALGAGSLPAVATSDFEPFQHSSFGADFLRGLRFNLIGGLLPQRSWFTGSHSAPVLFFSGCELLGARDYAAGLLGLPFGTLHGAGDRADAVDARRLYEQFAIARDVMIEVGQLRDKEELARRELEREIQREIACQSQLWYPTDPPRPATRCPDLPR